MMEHSRSRALPEAFFPRYPQQGTTERNPLWAGFKRTRGTG